MPNLINKYFESLNDKEKIAFRLAEKYLGSSFNIKKSIGFKQWLKS